MPICVPIKDMKDTAKFSRLVEEANGPITVTKNGYDAFVVMRSADYDRMLAAYDEAVKRKLLERIAVAESEIAQGDYDDYDAVASKLRMKYGL